jgi:peroxiredoxin
VNYLLLASLLVITETITKKVIHVKRFITSILVIASVFISSQVSAQLKDFDGKPRSLSEYTENQGKWTVVILWAHDCHACNVEAEQYVQFHEANRDKNIKMLGISMDGNGQINEAKAFIKRHDVTYPNLIGEFNEVASMYEELTGGSWIGTPTILVYDPKGQIQAAQPGAVPVEIIEEFILSKTSQSQPVDTK